MGPQRSRIAARNIQGGKLGVIRPTLPRSRHPMGGFERRGSCREVADLGTTRTCSPGWHDVLYLPFT